MHRSINHHGSCGQDGDAYRVKWNGEILTSETTTQEKSFQNILKCNHSAFNYPVITEDEAKKAKLYDYPEIGKYSSQKTVIGAPRDFKTVNIEYLNGYMGARNKVRIYTLFFLDKQIDQSFLQEAYWDGGNQNEIVVCIGINKTGDIKWVRPFSWCDNKMVTIKIRDDIFAAKKIDNEVIYNSYKENIEKYWHYKSFKDFNYLSFEPTKGQIIFVYLLTVVIALLTFIWTIKNETE